VNTYTVVSPQIHEGNSISNSSSRSLQYCEPSQDLRVYLLSYSPFSKLQHRLDVPAMSLFSYVRGIYALDTIDTRFTSSSSTPYKAVVDARIDPATSISKRDDSVPGVGVRTDSRGKPIAQPSKWRTPEFYFYYFIFIITVPYMFWVAYDVSRRQYNSRLHFQVLTSSSF